MASRTEKNRGGRPAKFAEPSRPVTVTLPERILHLLDGVDPDRAKAITKLVEAALQVGGRPPKPVTTVELAEGKAIILVNFCAPLNDLPWLRLIEVAPARHLISIRPGTAIESIEVALHDLLEDLPADQHLDRTILEELMHVVRSSRRSNATSKEEILFLSMPGQAPRPKK